MMSRFSCFSCVLAVACPVSVASIRAAAEAPVVAEEEVVSVVSGSDDGAFHSADGDETNDLMARVEPHFDNLMRAVKESQSQRHEVESQVQLLMAERNDLAQFSEEEINRLKLESNRVKVALEEAAKAHQTKTDHLNSQLAKSQADGADANAKLQQVTKERDDLVDSLRVMENILNDSKSSEAVLSEKLSDIQDAYQRDMEGAHEHIQMTDAALRRMQRENESLKQEIRVARSAIVPAPAASGAAASKQCCICLDAVANARLDGCGHDDFCGGCLNKQLSTNRGASKCGLCRHPFRSRDITTVSAN